ncbi:aromatic di-alanine and TPR containing protein, putative [Rhizoctonia solani AG-3 Rhs1AP]|uniref:Aromatic di-alanine and TPR containing protein, putative n=1 Tax=Rhizoctonia solani AG-3 Rhs1AP TaxID=1086054 RepID=X8JQ90_9AGAM|nr:aromatic di-alanine and TPR containing protein, putative [Rhizoctonia solani AG-3 Rhs1AP]
MTNQSNDINDAIEHLVYALPMIPEGDMNKPGSLRDLGNAYKLKYHFNSAADPTLLDNALECYRKSAQSCAADPRTKFSAACDWINLSSGHAINDHLQACQVAMDLVLEVVWIGSTIAQRYNYVLDIGKVAGQATAAAIQASKYSLAVEWLEQGRSIIWNQMLKLRDPLNELKNVDPLLADKLAQVASELYNASSITTFVESSERHPLLENAAQKRRRLAESYDDLLTQIRQASGFENFLRPKRFFELLPAAQNGPVVLINTYLSRCDALVVQTGHNDVMTIPLPNISYHRLTELQGRMEQLLGNMDLIRARSIFRRPADMDSEDDLQSQEFESILSILWKGVTKPVLDALGYKPTSSINHLPRVTWCATGPLSFLPLHAAGIYGQSGAKVYEYVVSSYTPTLSALLPAISQELHAASSVLGVGQEHTPGQNSLPHTTNELAFLAARAQLPIAYSQLSGLAATVMATLDGMEQHDWVHLACHAHQNASEPTDSGFFLQDGTLSLSMITQRQFKNKGLAFLSACQTATGDKILADESVHLASGMLMAGYPSIIATAWSIVDSDAPLIADTVYSHLFKGGIMDHKEAAKALHIAVGHLREHVGEEAFWRWAPYIHIGV